MRTLVEAHGGGVAVVLPADMAERAGLRAGEQVEVEVAAGRPVVRPPGAETLADLGAGITPENLNVAWPDTPPVGRELL